MASTRYNINHASKKERWITGLIGGAIAAYGVSRRSWTGALIALGGAALVADGVTGNRFVLKSVGIPIPDKNRSPLATVGHGEGVKIDRSVIIRKPADKLFQFWRNFENLPLFMDHLLSVTVTSPTHSHWVGRGPGGKEVEWNAEIYNEIPNELIAWRSVDGSEVRHAGSVQFKPTENGQSTEVRVEINYVPPAGLLGTLIAKMFGEEPGQQVEEDLRRLKEIAETEPVATEEEEIISSKP